MADEVAAASAPEFREAILEDYATWQAELDVTEDIALEQHLYAADGAFTAAGYGEDESEGEEDEPFWEGEGEDEDEWED